jgi:fructose-1,6-bisphosphatase/inositol monophosphatase family enzyme
MIKVSENLLTVANIMRQVLAEVALPGFGERSAKEVLGLDKNRGGVMDVTTAEDGKAELSLIRDLKLLQPGSTFLGEETRTPAHFKNLGPKVWIVDPIDGTNNYAQGLDDWGTMISYAENGIVSASWLLQVYNESGTLKLRVLMAEREGPFWMTHSEALPFQSNRQIDGQQWQPLNKDFLFLTVPLKADDISIFEPVRAHRAKPLGATVTGYFREDALDRRRFENRIAAGENAIAWYDYSFISAVGTFMRMMHGELGIIAHAPTRPWDYTTGAFFVEKCGGRALHLNTHELLTYDKPDGGMILSLDAAWIEPALIDLFGHAKPLGQEPCIDHFLTLPPQKASPSPSRAAPRAGAPSMPR